MEMYGNLILAICVAGACLTTAIGLVAIVGEFFSSITSFKYENIVIFTVIISFLLSILGHKVYIQLIQEITKLDHNLKMVIFLRLNLYNNF